MQDKKSGEGVRYHRSVLLQSERRKLIPTSRRPELCETILLWYYDSKSPKSMSLTSFCCSKA